VRLPEPVNTERGEVFASVTSGGVLYFSRSGGSGAARRSELLRAEPTPGAGYRIEPVVLPPGSPASPGNPLIGPDESYLLLTARARPGQDSDLYLTRRREDGTWSEPVVLGPEINTELAEFAPSVSPDGKYLFFARMKRGSDGLADSENVMVIEWPASM